ncbi:MAG TPA: FlgD immunoglobulin-like domain containing protein, partial [bacterium]|nr:FlgD immunoglobulin-like domain containing protein [bacterium]
NDGYVRIAVYNVLGQKIRNLISEQRTAGYHNVMWDGKNQKGSAVPSGIYIYRLETVDGILSKKMVLLK